MMIKSYIFEPINSKMYIIVETNEALVIDPNVSSDAYEMLSKNNISRVLIILTHEHCDHITGVNWFREHFGTKVICSSQCSENIQDSKKNFSEYFDILFTDKPVGHYHMEPFTCRADEWFEGEKILKWNGHIIYMRHIPGHSKGSICVVLDDKYAFTGDYLIAGYNVFTNLPGGSKEQYIHTSLPYIEKIKDRCIIFPGHGEP